MTEIRYTKRFQRDFKRVKRGAHRQHIDATLKGVLDLLAANEALPPRYNDHAMQGDLKDFRNCHLRPDLILLYRKPNSCLLELARIGSHSHLGIT